MPACMVISDGNKKVLMFNYSIPVEYLRSYCMIYDVHRLPVECVKYVTWTIDDTVLIEV